MSSDVVDDFDDDGGVWLPLPPWATTGIVGIGFGVLAFAVLVATAVSR